MAGYEVIFQTQRDAAEYARVLQIAGVTARNNANSTHLLGKAWNAIGAAPTTPQGSRLTYASGAVGPTPNVPDFVVEALSISFPMQIVNTNVIATRYYLSENAFYFLKALARAYQRRPDLAIRAMLQVQIRRLMEENTPLRTPAEVARAYSGVEVYVVVPTYVGQTDTATVVNLDIIAPIDHRVENYEAGAGVQNLPNTPGNPTPG